VTSHPPARSSRVLRVHRIYLIVVVIAAGTVGIIASPRAASVAPPRVLVREQHPHPRLRLLPPATTTSTVPATTSTTAKARPLLPSSTTRPYEPPPTPPHPVREVGVGSVCQYAALIRQIWQRDADWAIGIAMRESRCTATAYNRSGAEGVFQLLGHGDLMRGCAWQDPVCNITAAWHLYEGSGRRPWSF
jgi:hypothetical protein